MRKLLLFMMLISTVSVFAQFRPAKLPESLKNITAPRHANMDEPISPVQSVSPYVSTRSVLDATIIGNTYYDLQTNGSMAQRIYMRDDGKMGAVWTRGITSTAYPDRGTGYNFYDGTAWGPQPTARIEPVRTGFPSISQWNGDGEIVVCHPNAGALKLSKRDVAGTGTWTTIDIPYPSGVIDPSWPSIMTSGANHEIIHVLALSLPTASGGGLYNGLDGALLYWRSTDGGVTWEKEGFQFPQLVSPDYVGFSADGYSWAAPKGDTIAFVYGDNWSDVFVMWSPDNGDTWNKITVLGNAYKSVPSGTSHDPFYCSDGSNSLAIDKYGVFHVAFGRMRASEDASGRVYYPYTDGLCYWNSLMPQMQDSLNLDTLFNYGQLAAYVEENLAGDSILSIPYYGAGMTSYPNLYVDNETNKLYLVYSGVVVDNPSGGVNFRHIKGVGTCVAFLTPTWTDMHDFNSGIDDMFLEFVFPSLAKKNTGDELNYITQSSDVPGCAVLQTTVPVHDNNIIHNNPLKSDIFGSMICETGVSDISSNTSVSVSPNPFTGSATLRIETTKAGNALLTVTSVTGQKVMTKDLGMIKSGSTEITIDGSGLSAGIYLYSISLNGAVKTGKMSIR